MRASQKRRVRPLCIILLQYGLQKSPDGIFILIPLNGSRQSLARDLDGFHFRMRLCKILFVRMSRNRSRRCKDSDFFRVFGQRDVHAHLDDRNIPFKEGWRHVEGNGIARHQNHLHVLLQKEILDCFRKTHDFLYGTFPVGISCRIPQKDDAFLRILLCQHARNGKTAHA